MSNEAYERSVGHARALRRDMTPWERKLWYTFLKPYPMHIYRQRVIGPYIVDFYCHAARLAIELDGSQHFDGEGSRYDSARDDYLRKRGISVLRFPNIEVDRHFVAVCEQIDREINSRLSG